MPQPLPNPFQFSSYPTTQLCIVSILKGSSINQQKENDVIHSVCSKGLNYASTPTLLPTEDIYPKWNDGESHWLPVETAKEVSQLYESISNPESSETL
jgi:hypothetical protein